jgi:glycosyltransferase involved in cell wall biosynthesis
MIKFSVITCTYNAGTFIERTLDSVLNQNYASVEHIVIDGVSKDDTLEKVEIYKQKCSEARKKNLVIISEPDHGLYDAMNKGIRLATGDYICFINAGDTFHSDDTLKDIDAMVESGISGRENLPAVIYGDTDVVDEDGNFIRRRRLTPPKHLTWRSFQQGMRVCHQAFYARTDLAKNTLYNTSYKYSADIDWCIRIMKLASAKGLQFLNTEVTVANFLSGGMTNKNHQASLKERFRIMSKHYGLMMTVIMHAWFIIRQTLKP